MSYKRLSNILFLFLTFLPSLISTVRSQTCDASISEILIEDLTSLNSAYTTQILSTDVQITTAGTFLTTTTAANHGGFFFSNPTDFQGTGGFSLKFTIQNSDLTGTGDAWEVIVASPSNLAFLPPPFATGSSFGNSGWSRSNAFVVELDAHDSGTAEDDDNANHVAMYLSGTRICRNTLSNSLASGDRYVVWLDYNGFATRAEFRISAPNDASRPTNPTLSCDLDIWSTLDIAASNHVGFSAYNPITISGAEHRLVDSISIADGYKPYDLDDCASYAKCAEKSVPGLCVQAEGYNKCSVFACNSGWVWDVSGSSCCAFVEKTTFTIANSVTTYAVGDLVDCEETRRIVAYVTTADKCAT